ncbi:MAG: hypothetical protein AMJ38_02195 [Dehalococcoidia bacterium DG_22]|nr:MAG: hypothetical protein AMJ38_02195 [Dehalococcoidia bacterium DG_22]
MSERCPFAVWKPGPNWKVGYIVLGRTSNKTGVVYHSAEGPLDPTFGVLYGIRNASWHFTNDDSGLYQHYDIRDITWHAGMKANKICVGVENTGAKNEPLTSKQFSQLVDLTRWLKEQGVLTVLERRGDLWEHNEWMNTDCPSGRIPWAEIVQAVKEAEVRQCQDDFVDLRVMEASWVKEWQDAHARSLAATAQTLIFIRHSRHEDIDVEDSCWGEEKKCLLAERLALDNLIQRCDAAGRKDRREKQS